MLNHRRPRLVALVAIAALLTIAVGSANAAPDQKKAIWGPVTVNGQSQFPIYADLGVGIYEYPVFWNSVAPTKPANPTDPNDPAYHWPSDLDFANQEAARYGIRVTAVLLQSPPWANGGHAANWAPDNPQDFADFATAAAKRYPSIHLWLIWGEPTIRLHFQPFNKKTTPRRYAQILDDSYGALKAVSPANLVIGGNTITDGNIKPLTFIRRMRLPDGQPPRMDMYGHNPYSARKPKESLNPGKPGIADISDLDTLGGWLDKYLATPTRDRNLKIFISEWTIPTDHPGYLFGFYASRKTVAGYLRRALKIVNHMKRVFTFGWFYLYDDPPSPNAMNWGLLTASGAKKPAYNVFKRG